METLINLVLLFFAFSLIGWCIEVTLKYFQYHRFINRGFLTGPWLPIYGAGAVLITISVNSLSRFESSLGTTFTISFVVCGLVEYFASYFMEKKFHARWWDYSGKPMNLHGRIWIGNLILFGLGGVIIINIVNPLFLGLMGQMSFAARAVLGGCLTVLFLADYVMQHFVMKLVKSSVEGSEADNTEEINREVRLVLSDKSIFYRRFADAYPEVTYRTERVLKRMEEIKQETERLRRDAERKLGELSQQLQEAKESQTGD